MDQFLETANSRSGFLDQPVIMHINYCEQGQTLAQACQKAAAWGFDGIELRSQDKNVPESMASYLDRVKESLELSGLKHVVLACPSPDFFHADAGVREQEAEKVARFCQLAQARFELPLCNLFLGELKNKVSGIPYTSYELHGSAAAFPFHWERAADGLSRLAQKIRGLDIRLALETHMNYLHDTAEASLELASLAGSCQIGINLDYGNLVYFSATGPPGPVVDLLGRKIFYVHLKNSLASGTGRLRCGLGDSEINNRELLRALGKSGYKGPLCLESPRGGDREWYAKKDLAYIRSVLADLASEEEKN